MAPPVEKISLAEFAKELDVTARSVQKYCAEGMPYREVRNERYVVRREAFRWLLERERERGRREARRPPDDAETRLKAAQADLKEIELARARGETIPVSLYQERLESFLGRFSAVAQGQLARHERDIVAATTPADARRITLAIHHSLMSGAQEYADTIEQETAEEAQPESQDVAPAAETVPTPKGRRARKAGAK